jgi:hypothetical protein
MNTALFITILAVLSERKSTAARIVRIYGMTIDDETSEGKYR